MAAFRRITARDKPETIARNAAAHELHLRSALKIALQRAARSEPLVRELLQQATIEGLASRLNAKAAVVSFKVPEFQESWHEIFPWQLLVENKPSETARFISWSLREHIRQNRRALSAAGRNA